MNNLETFRNLNTVNKIQFLVKLHANQGKEAVEDLLNNLNLIELAEFNKNFGDFAGTDGRANRFRGLIRQTLQNRIEAEHNNNPTEDGAEDALIEELTTSILVHNRKLSLTELQEFNTETTRFIDLVPTTYKATLQRVRKDWRTEDLTHYIITLENGNGIHSFCWNANTQTLIYGLNNDPLDYLVLKNYDMNELKEVIHELLLG